MRELGKAKLADLNGHFAGEQQDAVSPLVRFLVNARQISDVEDGRSSETATGRHHNDTEAYPPILQRAHGNGHNGNGHNGNGHTELAPQLMEPQPEADV